MGDGCISSCRVVEYGRGFAQQTFCCETCQCLVLLESVITVWLDRVKKIYQSLGRETCWQRPDNNRVSGRRWCSRYATRMRPRGEKWHLANESGTRLKAFGSKKALTMLPCIDDDACSLPLSNFLFFLLRSSLSWERMVTFSSSLPDFISDVSPRFVMMRAIYTHRAVDFIDVVLRNGGWLDISCRAYPSQLSFATLVHNLVEGFVNKRVVEH